MFASLAEAGRGPRLRPSGFHFATTLGPLYSTKLWCRRGRWRRWLSIVKYLPGQRWWRWWWLPWRYRFSSRLSSNNVKVRGNMSMNLRRFLYNDWHRWETRRLRRQFGSRMGLHVLGGALWRRSVNNNAKSMICGLTRTGWSKCFGSLTS